MKYIIEQQTILFHRRILRGSNVVLRSLLHQTVGYAQPLLSKFNIQSLSRPKHELKLYIWDTFVSVFKTSEHIYTSTRAAVETHPASKHSSLHYMDAGAQPRLKSWGGEAKVWVPTPGRLEAPRARPGCWVREGVAPSCWEGPGCHPRKIFENSDAKSCILVTTSCEISCF